MLFYPSPAILRKTVLVTGANPGGIGNSLARTFHAKGLWVFATARDVSAIHDLAALGITTLPLEVTDDASIVQLCASISDQTGGTLDFLVNNAGRNYTMPATDLDIKEVKAMFDVNVFGVMRMCQVFAPLLIRAKGTIVQIASVAGVIPYVFGSSYNASKAALHTYSDTLRVELEPFGVDVVQIITGGVKSRIARVERLLPENSIYKPIEQDYLRGQVHSQHVGVENRDYAARVVRSVLGSPRRRIWEGSMSWLVWLLHNYFPHKVIELYMRLAFKLNKLKSSTR